MGCIKQKNRHAMPVKRTNINKNKKEKEIRGKG